MSNLYLLIAVALPVVGLLMFGVGLLTGLLIRRYQHNRIQINRKLIRLHQNKAESAVRKMVVANFPAPEYHLLNNITLPFRDGTTQIDHILISTKGVFVIETKHYAGWIFGEKAAKQWTQVLYKRKSKFQNPMRQNFLHLKALQQLLDFLPKEQIHSVVVFTGSAEFKTPMPAGVVPLQQLIDYLKKFQDEKISRNRVEFCVGRLECKRYEVTKATDVQHRAYLAEKFNQSAN